MKLTKLQLQTGGSHDGINKIMPPWHVTSYRLVGKYQCCRGNYCLYRGYRFLRNGGIYCQTTCYHVQQTAMSNCEGYSNI